MTDNIVELFPHKKVNAEKLTDKDIQDFLAILDKSLESFLELNAMEKFSLYKTLVEFTHTSLGLISVKEEN